MKTKDFGVTQGCAELNCGLVETMSISVDLLPVIASKSVHIFLQFIEKARLMVKAERELYLYALTIADTLFGNK